MTTTQTTAKCINCGRTLTSATSIARGYGRTCAKKIRDAKHTADLAIFTPRQLDSAAELIEDAAIIQLRGRIYQCVSTDGSKLHLTATTGQCNCEAGLRGIRCYHVAAARILNAA